MPSKMMALIVHHFRRPFVRGVSAIIMTCATLKRCRLHSSLEDVDENITQCRGVPSDARGKKRCVDKSPEGGLEPPTLR